MSSVFTEQILAEKLSKLSSTQQCIETLSHWCIFHRAKAESVVATWEKQFHSSGMSHKVPLLYLANDIIQNSKRKGDEFITEFWNVLPRALKEVVDKGDDRGRNVVSRLIGIWEERRIFGSHGQGLKAAMLGEELGLPFLLPKKRSRPVKIVKRDSRAIKTKLTIGSMPERIVSAFHSVLGERAGEDEETMKCMSVFSRIKKTEKDAELALMRVNDPSRKNLAKGLEDEENILKVSIDKLKAVEAHRVELVSQLRDALNEQESELENLRTQIQVAEAQIEEAANMRKHLEGGHVVEYIGPVDTSRNANGKLEQPAMNSAAAIAAEIADRLAASTSSQYIMTSVLSSFAAEEAKNAGLASISASSVPAQLHPSGHNSPYQPALMLQPPIQAPVPNAQPSFRPSNLQYLQPPSAVTGSYDYSSGASFPVVPPPPPPPPFVLQQPVQMAQQLQPVTISHPHQLSMGHQQQPMPPFSQMPGLVYYNHPYKSQ